MIFLQGNKNLIMRDANTMDIIAYKIVDEFKIDHPRFHLELSTGGDNCTIITYKEYYSCLGIF